MCTIVALHGLRSDLPLVIAANRDEVYARPATGAQRLLDQPLTVGGRDEVGGGTWMGVTVAGVVVAVTNQRSAGIGGPHLRSRGALVMAALRAGSVRAIEELLGATDARAYSPFNLLFGDAHGLRVAYARETAGITVEALPPGLVVLANDRIGSAEYPKTLRAEALVQPAIDAPWPVLQAALATMLADHTLPPLGAVPSPAAASRFDHGFLRELQALCIHTPVYGTRSAAIVAVSERGVAAYQFADGSPCTTAFVDAMPLFAR